MSNSGTSDGFAKVLTYRDLIVYGLVYIAPIGPWGTFAYVYALSGGLAVLAYLLGIVCMYLTANSYKEMAVAVEGGGSVYAYAREAFGPTGGFLAGWMVLLDYLLIPALMYVLAAVAMNALMPGVARSIWILGFAGIALAVNWFGIKLTARINLLFLAVQLFAVGALVVWAIWVRGVDASFPASALVQWPIDGSGLFAATSICILAFLGFDAITTLSQEVRPEQRPLLGRAIVAVLIIIGAIALVQTWVMSGLANGFAFGDLATGVYDMIGDRLSPTAGMLAIYAAAGITGIAITPPMLAAVARVLQAMATSGQLPATLARLDARYAVPRHALLFASVVSTSVALAFAAFPEQLTALVNLGALAAYAAVHLAVVALFAVRRRSARWMSHLVLPVLGLTVIAVLAFHMTAISQLLGAVWLTLGILYLGALRILRPAAARAELTN